VGDEAAEVAEGSRDIRLEAHECPERALLGLPPALMLISYLVYSTLKMEAICSSGTSIDFQLTVRRYIPEDRTLQFFFHSAYVGEFMVHIMAEVLFVDMKA
jgi:hypothetical protein